VYLTGNPAIYSEFNVLTQQDAEDAERVALPIAFVLLLLVFASVVAAMTPLVLALVAVPTALAGVYVIAVHTPTSVFVLNIATAVGLGISIDYSLFLVRRFREEVAAGRAVEEAVCWTVATAGEAILFSGLAVVIGFLAMLLLGLPLMSSVGLAGALVVGCAALAALTLLPAWLSVIGHRVDALPVAAVRRLTARVGRTASPRPPGGPGFWQRWALAVMRRPVTVVLLVSAVLLALGWPLLSINLGTPSASTLPAASSARRGLEIVSAQFPQIDLDPVTLIVQASDGSAMLAAANLQRLDDLDRWLAAQPGISAVSSLLAPPTLPGAAATAAPDLIALYASGAYVRDATLAAYVSSVAAGNATVVSLRTTAPLDSARGKALIDSLRAGVTRFAGLHVLVGGFQATSLDFTRYLYGNFPRTILAILIVTYLLLLLLFRSLLLPLKALLMNVLSVTAAYGLLVWAFQWGFVAHLLHSTSAGVIDGTIPIVLFCILFGLSMDYEVFLLSRMREEWLRTGDNTLAVAYGLEKTAGVITSAAALFVVVTGSITFGTLILAQESGFGMTVSILVDATIIRTLLVPAAMRLMGRWNWWLPRWLARGPWRGQRHRGTAIPVGA
jgi:RND superfamily putative drug exporter